MDSRVDRPCEIPLVQMTTTYGGISSRGSNVLSFLYPINISHKLLLVSYKRLEIQDLVNIHLLISVLLSLILILRLTLQGMLHPV